MSNPITPVKQRISSHRLVQAAASEKLASTSKQSFHPSRSSETKNVTHRCANIEEREMIDLKSRKDDFFVRCNVTVVTDNVDKGRQGPERTTSTEQQARAVRTTGGQKKAKKSVRFHKYDEVIYLDVKEYIYSLHDLEVDHEKASRDLVDDIEGVVGDVGYFLLCLKEGIQEEAAKSLGDRI